MSFLRLMAFAVGALCETDARSPDDRELLGVARSYRSRIRRRFNAFMLGRLPRDDSASAWFFREQRKAAKAREWARQKKALGLKVPRENTTPELWQPANQWRRDGAKLLAEDSAEARRRRGWWSR